MNTRFATWIWILLLAATAAFGCRRALYIRPETEKPSDTATTDSSDADGGDFWDAPKNVVLFIGDGMGPNQIAAAGMYENGEAGTLTFESFPLHGHVVNSSASYPEVTDSAAAATAIACGVKVLNHTVALKIPGDGGELFCLVDYYKRLRKSTGLVTTTYVTHATPSAFAAHARDRYDADTIAWHYLNTGRPEILFGGGGFGMVPKDILAAGYSVINTLGDYVVPYDVETPRVAGLFGDGFYPYEADGPMDRPHLYETAVYAVDLLSRDSDGFFVMIEGGMIDQAEHINRFDLLMGEMLAFEKTVSDVVERLDLFETLVIVTADHATGGLEITANNGRGIYPSVTWSTTGHNAGLVDFYAIGKGSDTFMELFDRQNGVIDNTQIFDVLTEVPSY